MNRDQKAAVIDELAGEIESAGAVFAVDYRGISVPQAAELRGRLREADAMFRVVKNSLTERAADKAGAEALKELLEGPTALTFVRGDAALAAKALADYARTTQLLPFKGGLLDGAPVDAEQIRAISRLPARDVLYGQLVGVVASPVTGLVRTLNALISGLAVALGQIRDQREAEEPAAAAAPETSEHPETVEAIEEPAAAEQPGSGEPAAAEPAADEPAAEEPAAAEPAAEEPAAAEPEAEEPARAEPAEEPAAVEPPADEPAAADAQPESEPEADASATADTEAAEATKED